MTGTGSNRLVIFMHIPKTGGSTLYHLLKKQSTQNGKVKRFLLSERGSLIKKQLNKGNLEIICSHHPFGLHRYCSGPFTYITMLRDPVDRVISCYNWIFKNKNHGLHQYFKVKNITFEQFLDMNVTNHLTKNAQTRIASGPNFQEKADLERAKKNLTRHFAVVGITEMFDESVFLMKQALGWEKIDFENRNMSKKRISREQLPAHHIEKIKRMNQMDISLYEWAKANLVKYIEDLDPASRLALETFLNRYKG